MGLVINVALEDGFQSVDDNSLGGITHDVIIEALDFYGVSLLPDPPYVVLSLDTEKLFPSIHSYPFFSSYCEINGYLYATSEYGIHKVSGDTDNGSEIHTGLVFNTDFGITNIKKIKCFMLDGDLDNASIKVESGGNSGTYTIKQNRVFIGRDVIGKDWDIRIVDFDRLDGFEVIPNIGRRR